MGEYEGGGICDGYSPIFLPCPTFAIQQVLSLSSFK